MRWNRPATRASARPWRIAASLTGRRARTASSTASAPAALRSWYAPAMAGSGNADQLVSAPR
jgi:hypothetical protein